MEENLKNYHFTDADLIMESVRVYTCINRDRDDFAKRGITPDCLEDFGHTILNFSDFPTDEEMQNDIAIITQNIDGLADLIQRDISVIQRIAESLWGDTGKYTSFGFNEVNSLADDEILLFVRRVIRVSRRYLLELEEAGLKEEQLQRLTELGNQFFDTVTLLKEAGKDKIINTGMRLEMSHVLYTQLVKLAETGKTIYEKGNEAKYNDYILYHEKASTGLPQTA